MISWIVVVFVALALHTANPVRRSSQLPKEQETAALSQADESLVFQARNPKPLTGPLELSSRDVDVPAPVVQRLAVDVCGEVPAKCSWRRSHRGRAPPAAVTA